jgi:exodeoxyribonuclease V gamma subunit
MFVHGNQPEELLQLVLTWMRRYPLPPLEMETVLVQSNGIAQWLRLALARNAEGLDGEAPGCGIAAALELSLPARFLWRAYRAVLGAQEVPEESPFDEPRLVWRLMRLLPQLLEQSDYVPLQRFLAADADMRKRFQLAGRLADLLDQYQVYRADWLAAWEQGEDVLIRADGSREPLPEEQRWQASLWRALLQDVAAEGGAAPNRQGRASVHEAFLQRAAQWPDGTRPPGLPHRLFVFGISSLPRQSLEVLHALSRWTQVLACVHNPCEHHWADIVADRHLLRATCSRQQRRAGMPVQLAENELHLHAHPLLAAWGRQGRDFIGLLDEYDSDAERARYRVHFDALQQRIDLFSSPGQGCLLHQLQDDIRELRPLRETRTRWAALPPQDDSIRFHIAHSPQREVEVLHDQLLAAFHRDPGLRPRDVIVMVPDIDAYAPHIRAVFGLPAVDDARHIPFHIADLGRRRNDPLVDALARLLDLPNARVAASDVLGLLEVEAVRRRFGIGDDALPLLQRWIHGAGVRWGLHAAHRSQLGLPDGAEANTWLFGLRRMLLGYAVGATSSAWREIEPLDEVGGLDAAQLGPLARLLERLESTWRGLAEDATAAQWCRRLRALLADFFDPGEGEDAYTLQQLDAALEQWQQSCEAARLDAALPLCVVAEHWLAQIEEGGLSQRFLGGAVTFATLMPMRAIPFRQVCLLGMSDGDYPRTHAPMDFDLMGRDYRPGDRSRREDDRYLFLEALLSARERLLVSWVGRSVNDNTARPPSVLVGQLRDHLGAGWRLAGAEDRPQALLEAFTVEHRLQPFSPDYFTSDPADRHFTYAGEWRLADAPPAPAGSALPPLARTEPLSLAELGGFLRHPVRTFFRERLKVSFDMEDAACEDQEPFELNGLQMWQLWDELIALQARAVRDGTPRQAALDEGLARLPRRGVLPCGPFGALLAERLAEPMQDMFDRYQQALARWSLPAPHDEEVCWRNEATGLVVEDQLHGLRMDPGGQRARVVLQTSDAVKDRHYQHHQLVHAWVAHLAAHLGGRELTTLVVSKAGNVEFGPLEAATARGHVEALLGAWRDGMCRPLPLAVKTGFAWLADDAAGGEGDKARLAYEGNGRWQEGELQSCAYLQRAWPDYAALSAGGEFQRLARALLQPLYAATPVGKDKTKKAAAAAGAPA